MASPVSPGDVLAILQAVYGMYKKFKDAPDEMQQAMKGVSMIRNSVLDMTTPFNQIPYFDTAGGKYLAEAYQTGLNDMKQLLLELHALGETWRQDSKNFFRKSLFIFWTMRHVPELMEQLGKTWQAVQNIRNQASQADFKANFEKLLHEMKEGDKKTDAVVVASRNDREVGAKKVRRSVQESADGVSHTTQDIQQQQQQLLDMLQKALKQNDIAEGDIKNLLDVAKTLQDELTTSRKSTSYMEILVVSDLANASIGVAVQDYLELARVWSANIQARWLFKRVDFALLSPHSSMGKQAASHHHNSLSAELAAKIFKEAMNTMTGNIAEFRTTDWPREERAIMKRLQDHRIKNLKDINMKRYNYILCVNQTEVESIKALASKALLHEDVVIEQLGYDHETDYPRTSVEAFLFEHFSWTKPSKGLSEGQSRTCWVSCRTEQQKIAISGKDGANRFALQKKTGCKVRTSWLGNGRGWIVAITGPLPKLREAKASVMAARDQK